MRDYDPATGRYLQPDPIGILRDYSDPQFQLAIELGQIEITDFSDEELNHLYGYVGQKPLLWYDPYGLAKKYQKSPNPNQRKGAENRQKSGSRERNIGHPEGEEHGIRPKGGFRPRSPFPFIIINPCLLDPSLPGCMDPCVTNPLLPECTEC